MLLVLFWTSCDVRFSATRTGASSAARGRTSRYSLSLPVGVQARFCVAVRFVPCMISGFRYDPFSGCFLVFSWVVLWFLFATKLEQICTILRPILWNNFGPIMVRQCVHFCIQFRTSFWIIFCSNFGIVFVPFLFQFLLQTGKDFPVDRNDFS